MFQGLDQLDLLSNQKTILVADSPGENSLSIRNRIVGLLKHQISRSSGYHLPIRALHRRFPVEKSVWQTFLLNAPEHYKELIRGRNSELLIWTKTDKLCKRLKIKSFCLRKSELDLTPSDFIFSELEPLPVEYLSQYASIISLFVLSQVSKPDKQNYRHCKNYFSLLNKLSAHLDSEIPNLIKNMPQRFVFTMKYLQCWSWFISGKAQGDTAKLGRAIRAYEMLISDWPDDCAKTELGQTLSNLAELKLAFAKNSTGMEAFEQALDAIEKAQKVFDRVHYPKLWAQLQELRAEAQICLAERHLDIEQLESAIHTLQTTKRIWSTYNKSLSEAYIQKKIGFLLHKLGSCTPGTERLEQAASSFFSAINSFTDQRQHRDLADCQLALGQTLIDLGERSGRDEYFHEAIKNFLSFYENIGDDKNILLSCQIAHAHALIQLGTQTTKEEQAEYYLYNAIDLLKKVERSFSKLDIYNQLHSLELLAKAQGLLGKRKRSSSILNEANTYYRRAIDIISHKNNNTLTEEVPLHVTGRLYGQLARNLSWLGRNTPELYSIDESISVYKKALEFTDKNHLDKDWAVIQSELAQTFIFMAKKQNGKGSELLELGIQAYRQALTNLRRDTSPLLWAQIRNKLGEALALSGAMGGGTPCLELAVESYGKALEEWTPKIAPSDRALTLNNMANVLADIARREENIECLNQAQTALYEAYDLFSSMGNNAFAERVNDNLSAIDKLIANNFKLNPNHVFDSVNHKHINHTSSNSFS